MTSTVIPVSTLKKFGGIRYKNATIGSFVGGYNFETFPAEDDGYGVRTMYGNTSLGGLTNLLSEASDYIQTEDGYNLELESETASIAGVWEHDKNGTKYTIVYVIEATEGVLYSWDGTHFTELEDGFTVTATNCNGIDFNNDFFFTNGVDNPVLVDIGTGVTEVTVEDAASRTHLGLGLWVYDNRIWMTSQYGVIGCANGDATDWATTGNAGAFYKDYFATTTAVYGFSSGIVVMGKTFTEFMTGVGADNYSFAAVSNTGAVGHKAICSHDNKVFFFNGDGIYPITYIDTNQRRLAERITNYIDEDFATIDTTKYADIQLISLTDAGKNEILFHARYTDYTNNSVIWKLDYFTGEWFKRIQQTINYLSVNSSEVYSAGDDGQLLQEFSGTTFDNSDIEFQAKMAVIDFGSMAQLKKRVKRVKVLYSPESENDFYFKYIYNGDPSDFQEYLVQQNLSGAAIWGDDEETYGGVWADDAETMGDSFDDGSLTNEEVQKPTRKFYSIQLQFEGRETGQWLDLQRIEFVRTKVKV